MTKVFGIGLPRTGTKTLGECFQILGYRHQSRRLDLVESLIDGNFEQVRLIADQMESFEDWPWPAIFKELDELYPESKFVLSVRDPDRWLRSYQGVLANLKPSEQSDRIRRFLYGLPFPDVTEKQLVERFHEHNREVESYFSDRPEDLLIVDWEKGSGWNDLCGFLNKPNPHVPLPHRNKGAHNSSSNQFVPQFLKKMTQLLRRSSHSIWRVK